MKTNTKRIAVIGFALFVLSASQIACTESDSSVQKAQAEFNSGVSALANSCLTGLATGNTNKLIDGPCVNR